VQSTLDGFRAVGQNKANRGEERGAARRRRRASAARPAAGLMQKARHRPHDPHLSRLVDALSRPQTALRVLLVAAGLTAVVTISSLSELSRLIAQANPDAVDWREVAGRAVKHAESLPHLQHHQRVGAASGIDGAAGGRKGC
jgi:hypothetical protein